MSDQDSKKIIEVHDIAAAISLLTRLPIPVDHARAGARAAYATWAFPLVGAVIGMLGGVIASICIAAGLTPSLSIVFAILTTVMLTGGMHEDGLADCADGFWGSMDRAKRLAIMKDSNVGVYGAMALILFTFARWDSLINITSGNVILAMMGIGAISRLPMISAMHLIPNARKNGLSKSVGVPPSSSVIIATILTVLIACLCFGVWGPVVVILCALATIPVFIIAMRKLGGQTGDVLGCSQQIGELAGYIAIILIL